MALEYRTAVDGRIKDVDETKRQMLVEFPHDVRDSFDTTFGPDCFRESFARRSPVICWQHDLKEPIGRTVEAQVTRRANELVGQLSDFDAVPLARRAFEQVRDGSLTDTSFGFVRQADEPHPELRGVTRITRATMQEWSPVTIGAIPGARVVGTRSEEQTGELVMPTLDEILRLKDAGVLRDEEVRAALAKLPEWREHITVSSRDAGTSPATPAGGDASPGDPCCDDDGDAADLAAAVDAALDAAARWVSQVDVTQLPDAVQQALALVQAAGVAVDDLLEVMGVADPDDDADGRSGELGEARAVSVSTKPWSQFSAADYTPEQWKAACLVDTGTGAEDSKDRYGLPVREPGGTLNKNALAAAAGRLGQVKAPGAAKVKAAKALLGLYNQAGMSPPAALLQAAGGGVSERSAADGESVEVEAIFAKHRVV